MCVCVCVSPHSSSATVLLLLVAVLLLTPSFTLSLSLPLSLLPPLSMRQQLCFSLHHSPSYCLTGARPRFRPALPSAIEAPRACLLTSSSLL